MYFDPRKIKHIKDYLDVDFVTQLYNNAVESPKLPATVGKVINGEYKTDYNEWCTAEFVDYTNFKDLVDTCVNKAKELVEQSFRLTCSNTEIHFLRYQNGAYYKSHIDGQKIVDKDVFRVTERDITCVMYLNDDYENGQVYFDFFDKEYKPKAGDVLIYPATWQYIHGVKPVNGTRYCIVMWFTTNPHINTNETINNPDIIKRLVQKL